MIRGVLCACVVSALVGCSNPYPIIDGYQPSYVRMTDQLRATVLVAPNGAQANVEDALSAGALWWDKVGAHIRVITGEESVSGPVVRAEMASKTESWVDEASDAFAYYNSTEHTIKIEFDFPYPEDAQVPAQHGLEVVLAHEIGHAMGLPHLPSGQDGLMTGDTLAVRLKMLTQNDIDLFYKFYPVQP